MGEAWDKFEKVYKQSQEKAKAKLEFDEAIRGLEDLDNPNKEVGISFYHLYETFRSGGFTEDQSLRILAHMFIASSQPDQE